MGRVGFEPTTNGLKDVTSGVRGSPVTSSRAQFESGERSKSDDWDARKTPGRHRKVVRLWSTSRVRTPIGLVRRVRYSVHWLTRDGESFHSVDCPNDGAESNSVRSASIAPDSGIRLESFLPPRRVVRLQRGSRKLGFAVDRGTADRGYLVVLRTVGAPSADER
jgi:hypothetical protein